MLVFPTVNRICIMSNKHRFAERVRQHPMVVKKRSLPFDDLLKELEDIVQVLVAYRAREYSRHHI